MTQPKKTKIKDFNKFLYNATNTPFSNKRLLKNIDDQKKRIALGKPSMIIIDGKSGEGKTTLGDEVTEYYQGKPTNYELQYGQGGSDFKKKFRLCIQHKLSVCIYDEAGDYNKRGFWSKLNKMLNELFDTYRVFDILVIVILPVFVKLDDHLFDAGIPRLLLHCDDRGKKYGNISVYGLNRMLWMKWLLRQRKVKSALECYKREQPHYKSKFKNIPPDRAKKLDRITKEVKKSKLDSNYFVDSNLMSYKDLADKLNRTRDWVSAKVSKLGIKEEEIFKRSKYFKPNVLKRLEKELKD